MEPVFSIIPECAEKVTGHPNLNWTGTPSCAIVRERTTPGQTPAWKKGAVTEELVKSLRLHADATVAPGAEFAPQFTGSFRIKFSQDRKAAEAAADRIITMIERYRV